MNNRIFTTTSKQEVIAAFESLGFTYVYDDNLPEHFKDMFYFTADTERKCAIAYYDTGTTVTISFIPRFVMESKNYSTSYDIVSSSSLFMFEYYNLTNNGLLLKIAATSSMSVVPTNAITNVGIFKGDNVFRYLIRGFNNATSLYYENNIDNTAPLQYAHITPRSISYSETALLLTKPFFGARFLECDVYEVIQQPVLNNASNYIFTIDGDKYVWGLGPGGVQAQNSHKMLMFKLADGYDGEEV